MVPRYITPWGERAILNMVLSWSDPKRPSALNDLTNWWVRVSITFRPEAKVPTHNSLPSTQSPCTFGKALLAAIWLNVSLSGSMQFSPPSSVPIHILPCLSITISRTRRPCSPFALPCGTKRSKTGCMAGK